MCFAWFYKNLYGKSAAYIHLITSSEVDVFLVAAEGGVVDRACSVGDRRGVG